MRERRVYNTPVAHPGDHLKKKIGKTAYDTITTIASAPAGGTVAGLKVAGKVKKIYDTWAHPKLRKPTKADTLNHGSIIPPPTNRSVSTTKPPSRVPKPPAHLTPPLSSPKRVRPHRGW